MSCHSVTLSIFACIHIQIILLFHVIFITQAAWTLKTRALTEQVYVDEVEVDEEGIAEMLMDDNAIAQVARPGTSLKAVKPGTGQGAPSQAVR